MDGALGSFSGREGATGKGRDYERVLQDHMKHDLSQSDRDALKKAGSRLVQSVSAGATIGAGLGIFIAARSYQRNRALFSALRKRLPENIHVKAVQDGKPIEADIPTILPRNPSRGLAIFSGILWGTLGLFLGGELGGIGGAAWAKRIVEREGDAKKIDFAMRKVQIDLLRAQVDQLERNLGEAEKPEDNSFTFV